MIPVADLFNHGCDPIEHHIINTTLEKTQSKTKYKKQKDNLDCSLLSMDKPQNGLELPFRLKYLVENNFMENNEEKLSELRR